MDAHQILVAAALAAKKSAETPKKARPEVPPEAMCDLAPLLLQDNHDVTQRLSYSSCRRHQTPFSLGPQGARSSHWYMPQRLSSPRA